MDTPYFSALSASNGSWIDFINMATYKAEPQLIALLSSHQAHEMEALPDDAVLDRIMAALRQSYSTAPPRPLDYVISRWGQNPYIIGSHSFYGGKLCALHCVKV